MLTGPPKIIIAPKDTTVINNGTAMFLCQAEGNPKPYLFWSKTGGVDYERITVKKNSTHEKSSFWIHPVKAEEDSTTYSCFVYNQHGQVEAAANLRIYAEDKGQMIYMSVL